MKLLLTQEVPIDGDFLRCSLCYTQVMARDKKKNAEAQKRYRERHPEKARAAVKAAHEKHGPYESSQRWAKEHPEEHRRRALESQRRGAERNRAIISKAKEVPCADCGQEYPPYVLDFHHVRGTKSFSIANGHRGSAKRLEAEIAKCVLLCANCHRIRHHGTIHS